MRLKVLGCSGGIGGALRTTSFLLDDDVLIDAGTGVGDLDMAALAKIDHVFVTHAHLDHVTSIPFLLDTVGWMRDRPIVVHAIDPVLEVLRQHLFNWKLWPDFTQIPDAAKPFLRYASVQVGKTVALPGGRCITPLPANHVVPAVGYHLDSGQASLVFTGDTTVNPPLWAAVNRIENLRTLIIETAFRNSEKDLAVASKHLCPSLLAEELAHLTREAAVYITHLKPGEAEVTMQEIVECAGRYAPRMLENNQVFDF
ncbi:MAG: MBL fold metallo-hydrolase [Burkholderiales bacterium]